MCHVLQEYYHNLITGESCWTKPEGFKGEAAEAVPSSQLKVPGTAWVEVHCEDKRKYYYNEQTEVHLRVLLLLPNTSSLPPCPYFPAGRSVVKRILVKMSSFERLASIMPECILRSRPNLPQVLGFMV